MKVNLAGYNLDTSMIEQLGEGSDLPLTPETIATAYARISRDPASVDELRKRSVEDVESARRSARSIVFGMNHQSVAEHAVFNFDIIDISRLAVEFLEWHRLCAYTEKSQRYQKLEGDYMVPSEFEHDLPAKKLFLETVESQNELYRTAFEQLSEYFKEIYPEMTKKKSDLRTIEGYAKEDARYATSLATHAQLGFTANCRNLEYMIRVLRSQQLKELRDLGDEFFNKAGEIAPSLILLTDPVEYEKNFGRPLNEDHFTKTHPDTMVAVEELFELAGTDLGREEFPTIGDVRLLHHTQDADLRVMEAILHSHSRRPAGECRTLAKRLMQQPEGERDRLIKQILKHSNPWEAATREFETVDFTFEVVLSAACFGQMKRHRMSTQLMQPYDPDLGYMFPPSVMEIGLEEEFSNVYEETSQAFYELSKDHPVAAQYVLTNGHRRRMILKANARELYHMSRLREDAHAQWDIRQMTADILSLAKKKAPMTLMLAYGKDIFSEKKKEILH